MKKAGDIFRLIYSLGCHVWFGGSYDLAVVMVLTFKSF